MEKLNHQSPRKRENHTSRRGPGATDARDMEIGNRAKTGDTWVSSPTGGDCGLLFLTREQFGQTSK